jgi:hypothetical protein
VTHDVCQVESFIGLLCIIVLPWHFFPDSHLFLFWCDSTITLQRPLDYSVSDIRVVFALANTPCSHSSLSHPHRSMGFWPFRQEILWDLLTIVYLNVEEHLHLLYPLNVWEDSISSNFRSWTPEPKMCHCEIHNQCTRRKKTVILSLCLLQDLVENHSPSSLSQYHPVLWPLQELCCGS